MFLFLRQKKIKVIVNCQKIYAKFMLDFIFSFHSFSVLLRFHVEKLTTSAYTRANFLNHGCRPLRIEFYIIIIKIFPWTRKSTYVAFFELCTVVVNACIAPPQSVQYNLKNLTLALAKIQTNFTPSCHIKKSCPNISQKFHHTIQHSSKHHQHITYIFTCIIAHLDVSIPHFFYISFMRENE